MTVEKLTPAIPARRWTWRRFIQQWHIWRASIALGAFQDHMERAEDLGVVLPPDLWRGLLATLDIMIKLD